MDGTGVRVRVPRTRRRAPGHPDVRRSRPREVAGRLIRSRCTARQVLGDSPAWRAGASARTAALALVATVVTTGLALAGCSAPPSPSASAGTSPPALVASPAIPASPGTALAAALDLTVKGRAPRTGYARDLFGAGWVDTDRNGCDTRNDILARDLTDVTYQPGTHDCVVLRGTLVDPFGGHTIPFLRGNETSDDVQIDHLVALADAWQKGAQGWSAATRVAFANDPLNLLAVSGPLNQQKGDGDTATWLPPNRAFRCTYVAHQVAVKTAYGLWVTAAERDAMVRILSTCPNEPLPGGS